MKSKSKVASAAPSTRGLTSRALDFWLLGGASIVVWALMFALTRSHGNGYEVRFETVAALAAILALFINSPHFMASYALAYRKGWAFIFGHWFQLLAVPCLLLAVMTWAWFLGARPTSSSTFISACNSFFEVVGLHTHFGLTFNMATELLSLLINFMLLTVGWHYTKQVYGCMMVYAAFDEIKVDSGQRRWLKANLFLLWWLTFSWTNADIDAASFFGLPYFHLGLPPVIFIATLGLLLISLLGVGVRVLWPIYRQGKRRPGLNFLVPYVAMYLWWFPVFKQQEFYVYLVPMFHSLQYLPFVLKLERSRSRDLAPRGAALKGGAMIAGLLIAGYAFFTFIPNAVDRFSHAKETVGVAFFFVCAQVFINVHHYFIDNVLWRFNNPEVRKYLLS
ncbi:MAG: hypothetical protein JST54_00085 [Deltaproteobacteria bacterium]|nr:hypothetical protein [Deltaproteobacteria bacterium]